MINMAIICGFVGADPEIRRAQNGNKVASFRIATSETWKDRNGEKQERTEWHTIVTWNEGLVGVIEKYVKKGSLVHVNGQLKTRKWQDQNGNDRYSTEIDIGFQGSLKLMPTGEKNGGGNRDNNRSRDDDRGSRNDDRGRGNGGGGRNNFHNDMDDDIPF